MLTLLMLAGGMGIASATAALWMQGRQMVHQRMFAGLISAAVTVIFFSVVAWAPAALVTGAPVPLIWLAAGVLALPFAQRLYRELRSLPAIDNS
jgi:cobalamin biosynthesis protein CobD/CbiB